MSVEFLARVRCFGEKLQIRRVRVDSEGYARVWDPIARHYAVTSLSPHQRRRLARLAGRGFWSDATCIVGRGKAHGVPGRRPVATDRGWKNLQTLRSGRFLDKGRGMQMLFSQANVKVLFTDIGRSVTTKVATAGEAAAAYAKRGFRLLPLPRGARPVVVGREPMTVDEVSAHWLANPDDNIGIETGHGLIAIVVSGAALTALSAGTRDRAWIAMEEALDRNVLGLNLWDLEICKMQAISGRSMKLLFTVINSKNITSGTIAPGFEVRSDGAYVVVPPSLGVTS